MLLLPAGQCLDLGSFMGSDGDSKALVVGGCQNQGPFFGP